jgi:hypothetical protein
MIGDRDPAYLRRRAREERMRAEAAADKPSRLAHAQLAALYEREADDADRTVRLTLEPSSKPALFRFVEQ